MIHKIHYSFRYTYQSMQPQVLKDEDWSPKKPTKKGQRNVSIYSIQSVSLQSHNIMPHHFQHSSAQNISFEMYSWRNDFQSTADLQASPLRSLIPGIVCIVVTGPTRGWVDIIVAKNIVVTGKLGTTSLFKHLSQTSRRRHQTVPLRYSSGL